MGYLLFSGVTGTGDWTYLFGPAGADAAQRGLLAAAGAAGLAVSLRLIVAARPPVPSEARAASPGSQLRAIYLAAAIVSLAAAAFDPAGLRAVIQLPPAAPFAGLGLLWVGHVVRRRFGAGEVEALGVPCHRGWFAAGALATVLFIAVLGPGIRPVF